MAPVITLTTDFGLSDAFVASMKGVILSLCPGAVIVDLTHAVPGQDVLHGAFVLAAACPFFPPGTVHVAVVDPGVGSQRRALAVAHRGRLFVGPDNGVLGLALAGEGVAAQGAGGLGSRFKAPLPPGAVAHELANPRYHRLPVSATFHGRDIFAPVAAHLALGVPLAEMGPAITTLCYVSVPQPTVDAGGTARGMIVHVDGFGNAVTNLRREQVPAEDVVVESGSTRVWGTSKSYAEADGPLAIWGSGGYLEVSVKNGSAARELGLTRGQPVTVRPRPR